MTISLLAFLYVSETNNYKETIPAQISRTFPESDLLRNLKHEFFSYVLMVFDSCIKR